MPPPPTTRILGMNAALPTASALIAFTSAVGSFAKCLHLFLVSLGIRQADCANFRSPRGACLLDIGGLALGLFHPGLGLVGLDVDSNLGLGQIHLHVGGAARLFCLDALILRLPLHLEGLHLLVSHLALCQHVDELSGYTTSWIYTPRVSISYSASFSWI